MTCPSSSEAPGSFGRNASNTHDELDRGQLELPPHHELLSPNPPAFPLSSAHPCTSCAHTWEYGMCEKKAHSPYLTVSSVFASQAGSGALERLL